MLRALLAVAFVPLIAGCGAETRGAADGPPNGATDASTARVEFSVIVDGVHEYEVKGIFDYVGDRAIVESPKEKRVSIGRTSYRRSSICGKSYWEKDSYERDGVPDLDLLTLDAEGPSPNEMFEYLRRRSEATRILGKDEIDGDSMTHYRFGLPIGAQHLWRWDAWVPDGGLVRRFEVHDTNRRAEDVVYRIDYSGFGKDADIEAPPAEEVITSERAVEWRTDNKQCVSDD